MGTRWGHFLPIIWSTNYIQGVKAKSGNCLSSKFGRNQCLCWNKRYICKKPLISALIWHPESGRGITRRPPRPLAVKSIFCWILWPRNGFLTLCLLWHGHALMIMPRPLSGCQIKAEINGFLLKHRLFQHKHWFFPIFELKDFPELTFTPCTKYFCNSDIKIRKI